MQKADSVSDEDFIAYAVGGSIAALVLAIFGVLLLMRCWKRRMADRRANLLMPLNGELDQMQTESLAEYGGAASVFLPNEPPTKKKSKKKKRLSDTEE